MGSSEDKDNIWRITGNDLLHNNAYPRAYILNAGRRPNQLLLPADFLASHLSRVSTPYPICISNPMYTGGRYQRLPLVNLLGDSKAPMVLKAYVVGELAFPVVEKIRESSSSWSSNQTILNPGTDDESSRPDDKFVHVPILWVDPSDAPPPLALPRVLHSSNYSPSHDSTSEIAQQVHAPRAEPRYFPAPVSMISHAPPPVPLSTNYYPFHYPTPEIAQQNMRSQVHAPRSSRAEPRYLPAPVSMISHALPVPHSTNNYPFHQTTHVQQNMRNQVHAPRAEPACSSDQDIHRPENSSTPSDEPIFQASDFPALNNQEKKESKRSRWRRENQR